jgi:hypothetical protein
LRKKKTIVPVTVKSKVTKRSHLKIMSKIKAKIADKLKEKIGAELGADIMSALQDKSIELQIKALVK